MDIFWLIIIILIAIFSLWLLKLLFSVVIKLLIAAIIVLILFAVFVHGAETRIFEGYVFSDQSITVDDKPFTITFDPQPDTIMLKYNRNYYFVPADDCKTIMNLKFCYDSYTYDIDKNKYKVDLIVYSVSPDIKITRTIDKKDLLVGEEAEISVNVTNGVGLAAENFTFIDSFPPDEFEITDVSWCSEENNSAFYSGYIKENDFLKCSYKIKPLKKLQRSSRAKVSYFDGTEMKDLYSSTIQFDVSP
ncbi:hypothetical protein KY308_02930, partial [Candidatus Woesearchaeota archaeon]|nr:hypothetical protein [Candidatus Woesearchaeota archaeon]